MVSSYGTGVNESERSFYRDVVPMGLTSIGFLGIPVEMSSQCELEHWYQERFYQ